ncbi:MAG: hypothetical protein ACTS27_07005 [Phycisphaerales bacterium]
MRCSNLIAGVGLCVSAACALAGPSDSATVTASGVVEAFADTVLNGAQDFRFDEDVANGFVTAFLSQGQLPGWRASAEASGSSGPDGDDARRWGFVGAGTLARALTGTGSGQAFGRSLYSSGAALNGMEEPGSLTMTVTPDTAPPAGSRIEVRIVANVRGFVGNSSAQALAQASWSVGVDGESIFAGSARRDGALGENGQIDFDETVRHRFWIDVGETFDLDFAFEALADSRGTQAELSGSATATFTRHAAVISARVVPAPGSAVALCIGCVVAARRRRR